jgi:branched-chain amino acid transport system substrate-binding protein
MTRRGTIWVAVGMMLATTWDGSSSSSAAEVVRIALIPPLTGPLGAYGADAKKAAEFAVDEVNAGGGVDGRKVELVLGETDGTPAATIRAAQQAVTRSKAQYIAGVMTSAEALALQERLDSLGALSLNSLSKADALTGANCSRFAFRFVQNNSMDINAAADTLKASKAKKWAIIAADYAGGHDPAEVFKKAVKDSGRAIVAEEYPPLGTKDFGPYISKLSASGAEGLFVVEFGADGVAFMTQAHQFGLLGKFQTVLGLNTVTTPLFKAIGDAALNTYGTLGYDPSIDTPANKKFVQAWTAKYGSAPYYVHADTYIALQGLFAAVRKAKTTEPRSVGQALAGLRYDSIVGPVTMRAEDHQLLRPAYIGQVVRGDGGGLAWKVVTTAPAGVVAPKPNPDFRI